MKPAEKVVLAAARDLVKATRRPDAVNAADPMNGMLACGLRLQAAVDKLEDERRSA